MGGQKTKAILSWNILKIWKTTKGRTLGFTLKKFFLFKERNEIKNGIIWKFLLLHPGGFSPSSLTRKTARCWFRFSSNMCRLHVKNSSVFNVFPLKATAPKFIRNSIHPQLIFLCFRLISVIENLSPWRVLRLLSYLPLSFSLFFSFFVQQWCDEYVCLSRRAIHIDIHTKYSELHPRVSGRIVARCIEIYSLEVTGTESSD